MLSKIMVPLDGSALSEGILTQVRRILLRQDAEVLLVCVVPEAAGDAEVEQARAALEERRAAHVAQGARADAKLVRGEPADGILRFAEEYHPSLIALSTHGRTGLQRVLRGSVAERVLRGSRFPLLLVNPFGLTAASGGEARFQRILVPLDGSQGSAEVLPLVREIAKLYASEVLLFHALVAETDQSVNEAEAFLEPLRPLLEGVAVQVRIARGKTPAAAILEAAAQEKADLVAIMTHGRSGLSRWLYGSVAEQVLRSHSGPLLVRRIGALTAEELKAQADREWRENEGK